MDHFTEAATTREEVQREVERDALFLFPTLVFCPQKTRAASFAVKAEIEARLDMWNIGQLDQGQIISAPALR
jgi:hypothetical protein